MPSCLQVSTVTQEDGSEKRNFYLQRLQNFKNYHLVFTEGEPVPKVAKVVEFFMPVSAVLTLLHSLFGLQTPPPLPPMLFSLSVPIFLSFIRDGGLRLFHFFCFFLLQGRDYVRIQGEHVITPLADIVKVTSWELVPFPETQVCLGSANNH